MNCLHITSSDFDDFDSFSVFFCIKPTVFGSPFKNLNDFCLKPQLKVACSIYLSINAVYE